MKRKSMFALMILVLVFTISGASTVACGEGALESEIVTTLDSLDLNLPDQGIECTLAFERHDFSTAYDENATYSIIYDLPVLTGNLPGIDAVNALLSDDFQSFTDEILGEYGIDYYFDFSYDYESDEEYINPFEALCQIGEPIHYDDLELTAGLQYYDGRYISILFYNSFYNGEMGWYSPKGMTFDLLTGEMVSIADLFGNAQAVKDLISAAVIDGQSVYFDRYEDLYDDPEVELRESLKTLDLKSAEYFIGSDGQLYILGYSIIPMDVAITSTPLRLNTDFFSDDGIQIPREGRIRRMKKSVWTFEYDRYGDLIHETITDYDGGFEQYNNEYDAFGNIIHRVWIDKRGQTVSDTYFDYDYDDRLSHPIKLFNPEAETGSENYFEIGWFYEFFHSVVTKESVFSEEPTSKYYSYEISDDGRRITADVTDSEGSNYTVFYDFDDSGRYIGRHEQHNQNVISLGDIQYEYNSEGQLSRLSLGDIGHYEYYYGEDGRLEYVDADVNQMHFHYDFVYDEWGNIFHTGVYYELEYWDDDQVYSFCDGTIKPLTEEDRGLFRLDEAHFPDERFREVLSEEFDADGDGILSRNEINAITYLDVSGMDIESLEGIEYLTELEVLSCSENSIRRLDVSMLRKLYGVYCNDNGMEVLILGDAPDDETYYLICDHNNLESIDVSGIPYLSRIVAYSGHHDMDGVREYETGDPDFPYYYTFGHDSKTRVIIGHYDPEKPDLFESICLDWESTAEQLGFYIDVGNGENYGNTNDDGTAGIWVDGYTWSEMDGMLTTVGIRGDSDYCILGISTGMSASEAVNKLEKRGYRRAPDLETVESEYHYLLGRINGYWLEPGSYEVTLHIEDDTVTEVYAFYMACEESYEFLRWEPATPSPYGGA